jgi:hypothetical protein
MSIDAATRLLHRESFTAEDDELTLHRHAVASSEIATLRASKQQQSGNYSATPRAKECAEHFSSTATYF